MKTYVHNSEWSGTHINMNASTLLCSFFSMQTTITNMQTSLGVFDVKLQKTNKKPVFY